MTFLNDISFKIFLLKKKKISKFDLNYHIYVVQLLVFEASFLNIPLLQNFPTGEVLPLHMQKFCIILLAILNKYFKFHNV